MKGKEQHLQLTYSLTCCNLLLLQQPQHLTLARILLAGHTAQRETMARAFVAGLHRVTLQ